MTVVAETFELGREISCVRGKAWEAIRPTLSRREIKYCAACRATSRYQPKRRLRQSSHGRGGWKADRRALDFRRYCPACSGSSAWRKRSNRASTTDGARSPAPRPISGWRRCGWAISAPRCASRPPEGFRAEALIVASPTPGICCAGGCASIVRSRGRPLRDLRGPGEDRGVGVVNDDDPRRRRRLARLLRGGTEGGRARMLPFLRHRREAAPPARAAAAGAPRRASPAIRRFEPWRASRAEKIATGSTFGRPLAVGRRRGAGADGAREAAARIETGFTSHAPGRADRITGIYATSFWPAVAWEGGRAAPAGGAGRHDVWLIAETSGCARDGQAMVHARNQRRPRLSLGAPDVRTLRTPAFAADRRFFRRPSAGRPARPISSMDGNWRIEEAHMTDASIWRHSPAGCRAGDEG